MRSETLIANDKVRDFVFCRIRVKPLQFDVIANETEICEELESLWLRLQESGKSGRDSKHFGVDLCEFSIHDNKVIPRGHRVVIPKTCGKQILNELHQGHYGSDKMSNLAGRYVWSEGIDKDISDITVSFTEAFITSKKTSAATLMHLQGTMARFGIPEIVVTDNDPTSASAQFNHFCLTNGIRHITSPPHHPASKGQVERYVNTPKMAL
ncbi:uncharacterized protein K02A2.6-like [Galendromus occidentalis]|uniref:RNA-directed DNA polymerase n=1 Tax=Galendromus occidentalis TaxID=34638 RepID=A0AAJ7PAJ5_9ACAR|nr:uncharacterized protein K02A2.6-like [Galendromus occidentalis]